MAPSATSKERNKIQTPARSEQELWSLAAKNKNLWIPANISILEIIPRRSPNRINMSISICR
jgi:hypothetical protein